eukprot:scaffold1675_cov146-Skeletonema_menzelii.AAC.8
MTISKMHRLGAFIAAIAALTLGLLLSPLSRQYPIFHWLAHLDDSLIGLLPAVTPTNSWSFTHEQLQTVDLRGQVALVTGANSGIGLEISKAVSRQGAAVVLGCRSPQRCFKAADEIRSDDRYSGAPVTPLLMDVSDLTKAYLQMNKIHCRSSFIISNSGTAIAEFYHGTSGIYFVTRRNELATQRNATILECERAE